MRDGRSGNGGAHSANGEALGSLAAILANTPEAARDPNKPWLLSPIDLQAVKAAGVTFARSMLERVIEEQAKGAPEKAAAIRASVETQLGGDLRRAEARLRRRRSSSRRR